MIGLVKSLKITGCTLILLFAVSSCTPKRGIEVLSEPVVRGRDGSLVTSRLSPSTRRVLRSEGLSAEARRDPASAIRTLNGNLQAGGASEQRLAAAELAMSSFLNCDGDHPLEGLGYLLAALKLSEPGLLAKESQQHADLLATLDDRTAADDAQRGDAYQQAERHEALEETQDATCQRLSLGKALGHDGCV